LKIGFVGFGEAAFHITRGLREAGAGQITAYDINTHTPVLGDRIQKRASETATRLVESNEQLASACDTILSTVTSDQAAKAANQNAAYLGGNHLYADLNSVSPAVKQSIARTIQGTGARFVEVAIMQPVPPYGHRVPMLAGGEAASEFVEQLTPLGMNIQIAGQQIGVAAATKMFRSVVIKGLEALLTECVLGASQYNAEEAVFASLAETFPSIDWKEVANYMVGRVVVHGERRAREMEEVAETLRALDIEPIMSEATARRMEWSARLGLKAHFKGEPPKSYRDVVEAVTSVLRT